MEHKDKKTKVYIITVGLIILAATIGAYIYHEYYSKEYQFKGLGHLYQARQQQYKLFTERKLTINNKNNPPKNEIRTLPSYKANFSTNLSDGAYLSVLLDFRFENAKGIKEMRKKWHRINFAIKIALSAYSGKDITSKNKEEILLIMENQIRKRIFSNIKYIYLDKFNLRV